MDVYISGRYIAMDHLLTHTHTHYKQGLAYNDQPN